MARNLGATPCISKNLDGRRRTVDNGVRTQNRRTDGRIDGGTDGYMKDSFSIQCLCSNTFVLGEGWYQNEYVLVDVR